MGLLTPKAAGAMAFDAAVTHASSEAFPKLPGASRDRMTRVYGLYKQATVGDCNRSRPGETQFYD